LKSMRIPEKALSIFKDTLWSATGLVLMNVVAQFVVYPYWNRTLGSEIYGNIVYLLAIMNIMAISIGSGINYVRMRQSADSDTWNRPYLVLLTFGTLLSLTVLLLLNAIGLLHVDNVEFALFCALTVVTMWRYYADVEYRLHLDYKGFFVYYLFIGIGYLVGIGLFRLTGLWPLTLLPGELAGLALVACRGTIFRRDGHDGIVSPALKLTLLLVGSNLLSHLIFNGDRIVLRLFVGGTAVSIYYIASLFGKTMTLISTPLNGVLVGYLAKYDGALTKKLMNKVTVISTVTIALATVACVVASYVVLPLLYPADFEAAEQYLIIASAAQVVYFVGNVLMASVLLRFSHARNQLIVNVVHGVAFVALCVPLAKVYGIDGFCNILLVVNTMRVVMCIGLAYGEIRRHDCEN